MAVLFAFGPRRRNASLTSVLYFIVRCPICTAREKLPTKRSVVTAITTAMHQLVRVPSASLEHPALGSSDGVARLIIGSLLLTGRSIAIVTSSISDSVLARHEVYLGNHSSPSHIVISTTRGAVG